MTCDLSRRIPPKNWRPQFLHLYCCFLPLRPFLTTLVDPQKKYFFNHISNNLRKDIKINPLQRFYPTFCRLSRDIIFKTPYEEIYGKIVRFVQTRGKYSSNVASGIVEKMVFDSTETFNDVLNKLQ